MSNLKKLNFKSLLSLILLLSVVLSFTACSDRTEPSSSSSSESSSSESSSSESSKSSSSEIQKPSDPEKSTTDKIKEGKAKNADVVGYLKILNTPAEGLVLQHKTDNFYYERRDITKNYNWYGCYYLDTLNPIGDRNKLSRNTIIYAHNMSDNPKTTVKEDQKFSQLLLWNDLEWAKNNPYIQFSTAEDEMVWEIFANYYTTTFYSNTKYNYHEDNPTEAQLDTIIKEAKLRSEMIYDVSVSKTDKILTLSTCTYKYGGEANKEQRYVVQARLVKSGEKLKDKATVAKNPSPKAPVFSKKY